MRIDPSPTLDMSSANIPASTDRDAVATLILVRHGETAWNKVKRLQGQTDIPLSDVGEKQARLLAARLKREQEMYATGVAIRAVYTGADREGMPTLAASGRIDAVISSDLSRAMQTAAPLAEVSGCEVVPCIGLRERHYGIFQGHDASAIHAQWPEAHAAWQSHDPDFAPDEGESLRQVYHRVVAALSDVARRYRGQTVICVAHGGVLDCAYRFTESVPLNAPRSYPLLNASANAIEWQIAEHPKDDRAYLKAWGDVTHLTEIVAVRDDE